MPRASRSDASAPSDEMAAVVALLADFRMAAMVGQVVQANGGATRTRA